MKVWRPGPIVSFRSRLAVLTSATLALVIVTIALVTYVGAEHIIFQSIDNTLIKQATNAIGSAESSGSPLVRTDFYGSVAWIVEAGGSAQGDPLPVTAEVSRVADSGSGTYFNTITIRGAVEREIVTAVPSGLTVEGVDGPVPLQSGGALQLTTPLQEVNRELGLLRIGIVIAALFGIIAAAMIGWLVARRATRPLDELTESIEHISSSLDDADRLSPESEDELGKLRRAFNRLLNAIDSSRAAQRQLVLDASHELRTPITSLRTNIEILPRVTELPPDDQDLIFRDMISEVEELSNLVGNLTELVRGEQHPVSATTYLLNEVLVTAINVVTPYSRTRGIEIHSIITTCPVIGHPERIGTAITNLLSNAIKWGPMGSTVEVTCFDGVVTVRDEGPGIAPEDLPHIFDRFYRSSAARGLPGSGLGLAIVAQAVHGDDGTITVSNGAHRGSEFVMSLPPAGLSSALTTGPARPTSAT
jgi:two-component system, OmpR family, sensor histidine kinase MprB